MNARRLALAIVLLALAGVALRTLARRGPGAAPIRPTRQTPASQAHEEQAAVSPVEPDEGPSAWP